MSSFTDPLIVTPIDAKYWKLVNQFTYHLGDKANEQLIIVPIGFVTDFASIPRFLWAIVPPWGQHGKAAVVHDFLYKSHLFSRKESDDIFLDAMTVLGVGKFKRTAMWMAVRSFGWYAWHKAKKRSDFAGFKDLHAMLVEQYWKEKSL